MCVLRDRLRSPGELSLLVRGRVDTASVKSSVTAAVDTIEPDAPFQIYPLREMVGLQVWTFKMISAIASTLGAIGLALAFSGTYAVVAFLVTARTREFGIRLALGGTLAQIVLGIVRGMLRMTPVGLGAGAMLAVGLIRFLVAPAIIPAFGRAPYLIGATVVLLATATAALIPPRRPFARNSACAECQTRAGVRVRLRSFSTTPGRTAMTRSTSASVFAAPRLKRIEFCVR
jgi:putative ABC transport system permease protein